METLRINDTDIILDDQGDGRGKIVISHPYGYNFSYYWGSMGSSLKEFLCSIDVYYFCGKLNNTRDVFCGRSTVKAIRRFIKEELKYELPWYTHMEFQKELRGKLKAMEGLENEYEFISSMQSLLSDLDFYSIDKYDRDEVREAIQSLTSEPWHFIETKPSDHQNFLLRLFPQLQKALNN